MVGEKATNVSQVVEEGGDEPDEEAGEEIESAPPLKVGEERELHNRLKKKLLKSGLSWETPDFNDEATVHYVGTLLDGTRFESTRDRGAPVTLKLGLGQVVAGLDEGIVTMKKGEHALFTLPPELGYGASGRDGVPPDAVVRFEVELVSWIRVVGVTKDGGIVKKVLEKGVRVEQPGELDQVLVRYRASLDDGTVVAESPEGGVEFYVKDGHLCLALSKAVVTMKRGEKVKLIVQPQYTLGEEKKNGDNAVLSIPPNSVLNIELELISFKPVIDVTGDATVFKKILKEGEGNIVADEGASVTISYSARLVDGTLFERKGTDGDHPLQFIVGEEQVIAGLDRAVATMKKGEQATLTIDPEYGFGSIEVNRDLATVPPSSTLVFEVEMLDFVKEKLPWELNNHEKIEAASLKKEEGNVLFKNGKYQRARKKYDKAVDYIGEECSFTDDEIKLVKALRVSCWLNGAACGLKLGDFPGAIKLCSQALEIELQNVKALFRRAQAYIETADLFSAELDIKKALEVDPQNRELKSLQKTLKQLQAESNKRDAKLYMNMFARRTEQTSQTSKKLKVEKAEDERKDSMVKEMEEVVESSVPAKSEMVA